MTVNESIDHFVSIIRQHYSDIEQIQHAHWIANLEEKLSKRYPRSFISFVTRYRFPSFEIGGIRFFANTGLNTEDELAPEIFRDSIIFSTLTTNGYIQFARPAKGSYDPICFATNKPAKNREYPIVRIDHEQILCYDRIGKPQPLFQSFLHFVHDVAKV